MWVPLVPGRGNSHVSVAVWAPRVPGGGDGEPYGQWSPAVVRPGTALGRGMNNHATYNQQLYGFFILPNLEIPPPGAWLHCCLLTNINIHHQYLVKWILICSTFSPQLEFEFLVGWSMCNVMILFVQHRELMADQEICWKMSGLCTKYHYGQLYCQRWPSDDIGYLKTDWTNWNNGNHYSTWSGLISARSSD